MGAAFASVSTLSIIVGLSNKPRSNGNGGFCLGSQTSDYTLAAYWPVQLYTYLGGSSKMLRCPSYAGKTLDDTSCNFNLVNGGTDDPYSGSYGMNSRMRTGAPLPEQFNSTSKSFIFAACPASASGTGVSFTRSGSWSTSCFAFAQ